MQEQQDPTLPDDVRVTRAGIKIPNRVSLPMDEQLAIFVPSKGSRRGLGVKPQDFFSTKTAWQAKVDDAYIPEFSKQFTSWGTQQRPSLSTAQPLLLKAGKLADKLGAKIPGEGSVIRGMVRRMINNDAFVNQSEQDTQALKQVLRTMRGKPADIQATREITQKVTPNQIALLNAMIATYETTKDKGQPPAPTIPYVTKRAANLAKDFNKAYMGLTNIQAMKQGLKKVPSSEMTWQSTQNALASYPWDEWQTKQRKQYNWGDLWGNKPLLGAESAALARASPFDQTMYKPVQWYKDPQNLQYAGPAYEWNQGAKEIQVKQKWRKAVKQPRVPTKTQLENTAAIYNTQINDAQVATLIPPIVRSLVQANDAFVHTGFGPVSKDSFPLYAARYIDPITGNIRTLPKPSSKYVNPRNYQDVIRYYEARVLSAWNSFVRNQQNLYMLYGKMRNGEYAKTLARKGRYMANNMAAPLLEGKAIQSLVKSILVGKDPYDLTPQNQDAILSSYDAGRPAEIVGLIQAQGKYLKNRLPELPQDQLIGSAIKAKYAQSFRTRGKRQVQAWNDRISKPQLSKQGQIIELYEPKVRNGYTLPNHFVSRIIGQQKGDGWQLKASQMRQPYMTRLGTNAVARVNAERPWAEDFKNVPWNSRAGRIKAFTDATNRAAFRVLDNYTRGDILGSMTKAGPLAKTSMAVMIALSSLLKGLATEQATRQINPALHRQLRNGLDQAMKAIKTIIKVAAAQAMQRVKDGVPMPTGIRLDLLDGRNIPIVDLTTSKKMAKQLNVSQTLDASLVKANQKLGKMMDTSTIASEKDVDPDDI